MIEIVALAKAAATILVPALPVLAQSAAGEVGRGTAKKIGEDVWEKAKALWALVRDKLHGQATGAAAIGYAAALPEGSSADQISSAEGLIAAELKKILSEDPDLMRRVADLVASGPGAPGQSVTVIGNESIGFQGGNVLNSSFQAGRRTADPDPKSVTKPQS